MALKQSLILLFMAFLWATSARAETYKAPEVTSPSFKGKNVKVQTADWDEDARFKVDQSASPERELASGEEDEEDTPVRNPSSNSPIPDKKSTEDGDQPEYWKYSPEISPDF